MVLFARWSASGHFDCGPSLHSCDPASVFAAVLAQAILHQFFCSAGKKLAEQTAKMLFIQFFACTASSRFVPTCDSLPIKVTKCTFSV
jgi:hypothetical protein